MGCLDAHLWQARCGAWNKAACSMLLTLRALIHRLSVRRSLTHATGTCCMHAMHFQNRGENLLGVKFAWCEIMRSQRPAFTGFPCPATEGNWSEPHLYIRGHTPRHAKAFVSKKERRTFSVAVFVRYNTPTLVLEVKGGREASVSGTKQEGKGGATAPALTAASFITMIQENYTVGRGHAGGRVYSTRNSVLKLLCDRASPHTANMFRSWCIQNRVELLLLPAKAADLDPLDYGVFNNVKHAWCRAVQRDKLKWGEQKQLLVQLLQGYNANAAIMQLPSRIQKCIASQGKHFEK